MKSGASRLRWLMIGMAFLATAITYMERQALSVVVPVLMDQFHMSGVVYSRVIFAFMLAYTIMNGVSGWLIDQLGTRAGFALTTAWWSMAAMLQSLATGAWSLGLCRFLLGMGEAGNWPGSVKVVAEWFPVQERALASGIFNSGAAVGAIVTPPFGCLDRSENELACRLSDGWSYRASVGSPLAVYLSDASKGRSLFTSYSALELVSPAVCVEFYSSEDISRSGLVLLRVLVSRVPEAGSTSRSGVDWEIRMDSLPGGRLGEHHRWLVLRVLAAPRGLGYYRAEVCRYPLCVADGLSNSGRVRAPDKRVNSACLAGYAGIHRGFGKHARISGGRISQECRCFYLGPCRDGLRVWRHGVCSLNRVAG